MTSFKSFTEFVEHARLAAQAFHGQLMEEPRLTDDDRQSYRRMLAALAVGWLTRSRDVEALTQLRDQITDALRGIKQLQ